MGIFVSLSSLPKADSAPSEKPDSARDSVVPKAGFSARCAGVNGRPAKTCQRSGAAHRVPRSRDLWMGRSLSLPSAQYRPDVDGLRAIAVMLVMNFHAFPASMPGGFIGVDVFFVISGFLITGIIARELEQKRFSLLTFYGRRIRRIFPALIVVLIASLIAGWLWMLPAAFAQLGIDTFASAGFAANIALQLQSGYFDVESAT